jgi:hypothetical protein
VADRACGQLFLPDWALDCRSSNRLRLASIPTRATPHGLEISQTFLFVQIGTLFAAAAPSHTAVGWQSRMTAPLLLQSFFVARQQMKGKS